MEAPDKIFCWRGVYGTLFCSLKKEINIDCTEYIRKDALLEWAKEEQAKCSSETHPYAMFMNVVIDKLDSL